MNKVYKVIWNASIGAWVATSEIAKSKTKTKSKTLNVSAAVLSGVICFAPNAFAGTNTEGGIGQGTSISGTTSCREGSANTANQKDIAIGCGAQTQDRTGSNIANRNNPYNNSTGAYAGAMKQGGAISVGTGAVVEKGLGTAIGSYATTQGISGVAIGTGALSSGNTALAVGRQSAATADFSQAIGNVAAATGKGSLAIGHSATAEGYRSIAIGSPDIENADPVAGQAGAAYQPKMATKATGKDSIAFGGGAVATEENALAIGAFSESKGKKSVAIGTGAKAQKDNAVVIGDQAEASFEGGVAIGKGARSEAENSIALGKDSKASQATGESFLTKQSAPTGVLSIGDIGTERRIQNVADGAADSDAATVRQLKAARTHYVSINDNGQQGGNFENDGATGRNAIAVGVNASAAGREAMAIGGSAQAIGSGAIAMGSSSQTVGRGDVAIGRNASTQGAEGVNSNQSVAIGDQTKAIGDQSVAIGADVIAKGNSSVAIGGDDVDKIARDTELSNTYTEITGGTLQAGKYPTTEANHGSTAVGVQAVGTGAFSSAFGMTSKATGDASSAFGVMSNASGKGAAAFGAVAQATGDGASAMGINSLASGTNSTAIGSGNKPGEGAKATGNSAAAIGSGAQATGDNSAAIGKGAEATNENAAAVGGGAKAAGKNAAAIGGGAIADQENAVAVGQGAQSLVEGGVALGARSKVEAKNSVALGQDAVATEATGTSFLTNRDASQSNGVISVGSAGKERRITNVEDGSADSDAVTVRQLKNVDSRVNQNTSNIGKNTQNITNLNQKLDDTKTNLGNQITDTNKNLNDAKKDLGNQITDTNTKLNTTKDQLTTQINDTKTELNNTIGNTKTELNSKIDNTKTELENKGHALGNSTANNLGGGASYDSTTGAVSSPTYVTTKTDGTTVNANNVGDALTNLNNEVVKPITFAGNSGSVDRKLGETLNITGGLTASGSNSNVKTVISGNTVDIQLADAPVFAGKLTANGLDANGEKVTNVGEGTAATDAVNKGQLDALSTSSNNKTDALGNSTANNLGGGASYDSTTGAVSSPTYTVNGNNVNNVGDAITALDKGWTLQSNGTNAAAVKAGDTVDIGTVAGETNLKVTKTGNTIQYGLNRDLNIDSVTAGDSKLDTNGLTIAGGPSVTKTGIDAAGNTISNVAAGTNATDAVNKGQLDALSTSSNNKTDALGNSTANNLGGGASYDSTTGAVSSPTYVTTKTDGTTVNANNVGDALTNLNNEVVKPITFAGNSGSVDRKLGETLNITGGLTASGSNSNVKTVISGNTVDIQLADAPVFAGKLTANGLDANGEKVTNVGAGTAATDAVNKGQLDALSTSSNNKTDALGNSTANNLGGGASYDSTTGAVSSPTYTVNGNNVNNVGDAITALDKGWTLQSNGTNAAAVKAGDTVDIGTVAGETNLKVTKTGNTIQYGLNRDLNIDSVTAGDSKLDTNGLTIAGGPSVTKTGIDAAGNTISNVAAGTNATDAVNKGQLDALSTSSNNKTDALGNSTANNLGGGASYDSTTGAVSSPTYTVNGNNVNNVGDAITALDKGWTLQSNGTNAAAVKAGDTVDIGTVAGETNLNVTKTGNTIQYGLNRDLNIDSVTAGDSKLDTNGLTIAGGPSVTKTGIDAAGNTISNVAAGTNATDAVNKGQLDHVDNRVTQVTNTTASIFGGGAKANTDGSISNPTYNVAGTSANNVGDALTALDKAVTDAGTAANAGWTVSANGDAATAKKIKPNGKVNFTGDDNLTVAQSSETDNEGNIKVALNKNLKVDSVTTGNTVIDTTGVKVGDNVQLGSTGLIIAGGPSITTSGISAGNKTISNVAAGVSSTDAVNKGQLDSAISSINNNVGALANSAVQYDKNSDGSVNKDSITLAGGANGTTIKNVANGTVAEGSKDAVNGGQLWTVQQQVNKNTGDISNLQTDISNINNGKSGLVQQADKDAAITVGKDTGGTQVNVAGTAGERTVTGVKAGAVTESSKDAVNGSQLNTTNQALVNYLGGGAGYDNITQSFSNPTYNVGDQSYHNVGDAIGALNQADQTLNTKIDNVSNKLEQAFYATNQRIDDVEKRANAGIAAAMALENAPFVAGKYTYAVGAAYHGGENAVGVTLRKTADNGRWSLTGGVAAASQGDPSVRIGISGVID
ncbi:trimeric autotransporter adhesin Ata [Acinetobacter sp. AOR07_HL]|uniref:trimeric autotransporter adhesin Ata n=1 Tax=Acinetobacter TaxID=469 RepID=UPI0022B0D64D|nr:MULTISPECIES: trimeric autotransporter adhesin Ata [Acinetobacter]WAX42341.1 trimeric autotransporter adhesin Ata [Acinetobacter sp. AOR07_HL]